MSSIKLEFNDFGNHSVIEIPEVGISVIGFDLDGNLKKKDSDGVVTNLEGGNNVITSVDNFVRVITIQEADIIGLGSIEDGICSYILALPEAERTILETDSKWNIHIIKNVALLYNVFERGASSNIDLCSNISQISSLSVYVEKTSDDSKGLYPFNYGSPVFEDPELTIALPNGSYDTSRGKLSIVNGVASAFICPTAL